MKNYVLMLVCVTLLADTFAQQSLAFPGADGFGKYTQGGRGGMTVFVTNLNDSGPGSLREGIQKKGPRTIIFCVSGTIALESALIINNGYLTIAGQSAPGDGICVRNFPVVVQADEVIIRFMRFRLGNERNQEADALSGSKGKSNIIIDHCSISWATDECASFYRNKNFTLQWCIISESLNESVHHKGNHGYGGIWGGERASFHHNLIAHHNSRMPRFSGSSSTPNSPEELVDFRNNVIFNWMGNNTYGGEKGRYNVVANFYKAGPASKKSVKHFLDPTRPYGQFFVDQNVRYDDDNVTRSNSAGIKADHPDSVLRKDEFTVESVAFQDARTAYDLVLKYAGASFHRDVVDARIVREVADGTATSGKSKNGIIDSQDDVGGWPELKSMPAPKDNDKDGIDDEWERRNRLNPANGADAVTRTLDKNYDNLEVYLNSLVESLIKT
jgi:hypothetical protein